MLRHQPFQRLRGHSLVPLYKAVETALSAILTNTGLKTGVNEIGFVSAAFPAVSARSSARRLRRHCRSKRGRRDSRRARCGLDLPSF